MVNRNCRRRQELERLQAEAQARTIIAQGRQAAREVLERRAAPDRTAPPERAEEPMNRYIHPIPAPAPCACPVPPLPAADPGVQECLERILEALVSQNQFLLDLLGAVNSLTAATLSVQAHQ